MKNEIYNTKKVENQIKTNNSISHNNNYYSLSSKLDFNRDTQEFFCCFFLMES